MASTTIRSGGVATKDPSDTRIFVFDWDAENLEPGITIATSTFALSEISPTLAWSSTTLYLVGDQVVSAGVIYACILAHVDQMPPNVTYWAVVTPFIDLTKDNEGKLTGDRKTSLRLMGGTPGHTWDVANTITTNETPSQTKERSFRVLVEQL